MSKRTDYKMVSPEGQVLRKLRKKRGLTMIEAGKLADISDSYISQIENGRSNPPTDSTLAALLRAYGEISLKYFHEQVRDFKAVETDEQYIGKVLSSLPKQEIKFIRQWIEMRLKEGSGGKFG